MSNANPSIDPANEDSLTGMLRHTFNKLMQAADGALPAKIIAFDRDANVALVQPLIQLVNTNGEFISRGQVASVPVFQIGGNGFMLNFNLTAGDEGVILAMDRDISLYSQSGQESPPNTFRIKTFSDCYFYPNVLRAFTIASEDASNAVFQSLDGTVKISLGANKIKISAPTVEIDGETVNINASTELNITSPEVNIDSSTNIIVTTPLFAASENITAGGTIIPGTPPP